MVFGEKLQQLRKQKGLSQEQLALQLGVSRQAISKWELSDSLPDAEKIIQLSDFFNVSTDYLLKDAIVAIAAPQLPATPNPKRYANWLGIACVLFSAISFFVVWVLAKIYPAPIVAFNATIQLWKVGLENFIWVHGLENFMLLLDALFAAGIFLLCHKYLKKIYQLLRVQRKPTK